MKVSADGAALARAYELYQTTDLSFVEIERALEIRSGTLRRSLSRACGLGLERRRQTTTDAVFEYLKDRGERRTDEIIKAVDASSRAVQEALKRLKADGKIITSRCRVDRRMRSHRVSRWLI